MTKEQVLEQLKFDLESRGRSPSTVEDYMAKVGLFQDHYGKPADQMGETEILEYQHYLLTEKKLKPSTVNTYNSAIRFVYGITLNSPLNTKRIPHIRNSRSLPILPTKEELGFLFYLAGNSLRNKALFLTIYGSGIRLSEAANLKVGDIDSAKGRIFVRKGKGGRDRYALLPKKALEALRAYWSEAQPKDWLFVTKNGTKMAEKSISDAWKAIVRRSGIPKHITVHTLRHCFATHLLEEGRNPFVIKQLLGHVTLHSTLWYLQLADSETLKLKKPAGFYEGVWQCLNYKIYSGCTASII